jgi:Flp pilus assembly protein TadD
MIQARFRPTVFRALRCARIVLFFLGAQSIASLFCNQPTVRAQSSPKPVGQSKSQKIANPLNELLDEAQHDIDKNDFEAAIAPLQKVLADQPSFAYAHFQLAYVYTALMKTGDARTEYERAIAADPKMSEAHLNLGILLLDKHEYTAAVAPLRKAVELLPLESRPRSLLGVALDHAGDEAGAAEAFGAASRLDPGDFMAVVYLGWFSLRVNRPAEAQTKFQRALQIRPNEPSALQGLAQSLDAQKKPEAADAFRNYLSVQPSDAAARSRLVHLLLDSQEYDAALAELDRAEAKQAPALDSLRLRADVQIAAQHWDDAVVTLRRAIALSPKDAQLHGGLGRVLMQKRDFSSAETELRLAIQLDANNLVFRKDLSSTTFLAGNYPATLGMLDEMAKVETPGAGTWFIRAICYDKLNQPKPALEAYQKFLALDQDKNPDQVWQAQQRSKALKMMLERKR